MSDEIRISIEVDPDTVTAQEVDAALDEGIEIKTKPVTTARALLMFDYIDAGGRELRMRKGLAEAEASVAGWQAEAHRVREYRAELAHGIGRLDYDDMVRE